MKKLLPCLALCVLTLLLAGCLDGEGAPGRKRTLTLAAYTTPREVYGKAIIPAFKKHWKEKTGESLEINESYQGSGAQSRAIIGGFEADIAALSLEPDIERIAEAKLLDNDWRAGPHQGMVTRSVVVICVRKGNPKNIQGWSDLARADVEVLTPNPRSSGGAMWNIAAIYGAALRGDGENPKGDARAAQKLLSAIMARVKIMDSGARESMLTFERGVGDAAITYENEVLTARKAGKDHDYVIPSSTILIENPAAVVTANAKAHKTEDIAKGFVEFLTSPDAQRSFAEFSFRPVSREVSGEFGAKFRAPPGLFTIKDLGGWPDVIKTLFGQGGVYERATMKEGEAR